MASGAEVISTKFFHAFGYHVPENYLATFKPSQLVILEGATMKDEDGKPRRLVAKDIDNILEHAARRDDGSYRVLASRNLRGRPVGPFRYYGTRPDDPNDIFPHEHRRELRALSVFSAWLNHDEVRSTNSLDTLVDTGGRQTVRHHLLDFGSTLGSGSVAAQSRRAGNEFVWESRPTFITMLTLGFYVRPWIKIPYPRMPAVGRIESTYFRPEDWKADYPNPAFKNLVEEDRFWGACIVARFTDEAVRAMVETARFSNPAATDYLTKVILERRAKVPEYLVERDQSPRQPRAQRQGRTDLRKRSGKGRCRQISRALHRTVVPFRQRHRAGGNVRWRGDCDIAAYPGAG